MTNYVGLDFEYANKATASICAYGLAFMDGSQEHGYVKLHEDFPLQQNRRWHGISQEQTDSGMHFTELYERLAALPEDTVLVVHDLKSDRRAWLAAQSAFGLPKLKLKWLDALPVARKSIGGNRHTGGGGVKTMARLYKMEIVHHNPADDALVSLEVIKRNPQNFNFVKD